MSGDYQARLDRHDMDIRELREGQSAIIGKLDKQDATLGAITNALTEMRVSKGPPWHQIISTGTQVVIVIGAIVSGIVYIASNGQSQQQHGMDKRVEKLEWRMDRVDGVIKRFEFAAGWKPSVARD